MQQPPPEENMYKIQKEQQLAQIYKPENRRLGWCWYTIGHGPL